MRSIETAFWGALGVDPELKTGKSARLVQDPTPPFRGFLLQRTAGRYTWARR